MSELEINDGNCVLSDNEIKVVDKAFTISLKSLSSINNPDEIKIISPVLDLIFIKINKLNDIVKQAKEKQA